MFNKIQEDDIFSLGSDCSVKWVLGLHFEHVIRQRRGHVSKVITRKVTLHIALYITEYIYRKLVRLCNDFPELS